MRHTRTTKRALAAMALVVTLVQGGSSFAAGPPDIYKEGKQLIREGRWQELYDKFREAYSSYPDPQYLLWMGLAKSQLGDLVGARELYEQAKKEALQGGLAVDSGKADEALEEISERIPRIKLNLPNELQPVEVSVDGKRVELFDRSVWVNPGRRSVVVSAPGRENFRAAVIAREGDLLELDVVLVPEKVPPPPKVIEKTTVVERESHNGLFFLMGVGGVAALAGAVLLPIGIAEGEPVPTTMGATSLVVGGGLALVGGGWIIFSAPKTPAGAEKRAKSAVSWAITPTPRGVWGGVGWRF